VLNREPNDLSAQGHDIVDDFGPGELIFRPPSVSAAGKNAIARGFTSNNDAPRHEGAAQRDRQSLQTAAYGTPSSRACDRRPRAGKRSFFKSDPRTRRAGDEVTFPRRTWSLSRAVQFFAGGTAGISPTRSGESFPSDFSRRSNGGDGRTRGVIINSPCNRDSAR